MNKMTNATLVLSGVVFIIFGVVGTILGLSWANKHIVHGSNYVFDFSRGLWLGPIMITLGVLLTRKSLSGIILSILLMILTLPKYYEILFDVISTMKRKNEVDIQIIMLNSMLPVGETLLIILLIISTLNCRSAQKLKGT